MSARFLHRLWLVRAVLLGCVAYAQAIPSGVAAAVDPNGVWSVLVPVGGPGAINQHGAIYDPSSDQMVVFGGAENIRDTWTLSLGVSPGWTKLNPSGPSGRKAMAVVYDPIRRRMLMFGGYDNYYENDVWSLWLDDPVSWTQLAVGGPLPSGRMFTLAIYDPSRDRVVVFGGHPQELNDVWELSLSGTPQWTEITVPGNAPYPRYGHVGVYDPIGDRLVIFGGSSGRDETWALSLSGTPTWTRLALSGPTPPARQYSAAIYDVRRSRMVMCGGLTGTMDVWALNLVGTPEWTLLTPTGTPPTPRWLHTAIYQPTADRMVVFGGLNGGPEADALTWGDIDGPPVISAFNPPGGQVGDPVRVYGTSLGDATEVAFNGIPAPIIENVPASILTSVPLGATTGPITVTTALGTGASPVDFFVGEPPEIQTASPMSGKIGATITLGGQHFTRATRVAFGAASHALFTVDSDVQITAVVDKDAATGPVSITTPAATGTSAFSFAVLPYDSAARIVGVTDIPGDQGGTVSLRWLRSDLDTRAQHLIASYRVWRRAPVALSASASGPDPAASRSGWRREVTGSGDVVFWEPLTLVPAAFLDGYAYTAPTNQDSTADSNTYTAFFIQTLTADPLVFYNSPADSGYSVDNLSPPMPMPFVATYGVASNALHWTTSRAQDLREFWLHRGNSVDFVPSATNRILASRDTGYVDGPGGFHYKLAAVDVHGNVSRFAVVSPEAPVAALASLVSSEVQRDRVRLVWYASGGASAAAGVYRRTMDGDWARVGFISADGGGYLRYEDSGIAAGTRYGYRLGFVEEGQEVFAGEVWLQVPRLRLALGGARPNPAVGGRLRLQLTLVSTAPARLEVIDVTGRVVRALEVGPLGPGSHDYLVGGDTPLRPGVYFLRLHQGGEESSARVAVVD